MKYRKSLLYVVAIGAALAVSAMAKAGGDAAAGQSIYEKSCRMCHATGMMKAPKLGDKEAWAPRIAAGEEELVNNAIAGMGKMPPRGNCRSCSDEDLANAVAYIVSKSQ